MSGSVITLPTILFCGAWGAVVWGQTPIPPSPIEEVACSYCHLCEKPTAKNPCLGACPRTLPGAAGKGLKQKRVPDVVILDELEDLYLPVPFDHKGHADMAEMTVGCVACHHYTAEGAAHPACKSCHEVAPVREDMRKPGLKGAYHRQCMACHREWSHETACEVCHAPKAGRRGMSSRPTKDDIVGRMHPPIPEPDVETYQTRHKFRPGTKVTFRHREHIHRFGFRCAECHREDNCSRCHEEGKKHTQSVKTLEEHHNPCARCHDMEGPERCGSCHWEEGASPPEPFDHAATGWPLNRYHQDKRCRSCHKAVPFAKLDKDCQTCHGDWAVGTFDHSVTGQRFDETHAEVDCEECHIDRRFDRLPTCDECHEEDEGIVFPSKRPGAVASTSPPPPGGGKEGDK